MPSTKTHSAIPAVSTKAIRRTVEYWETHAGVHIGESEAREAVGNLLGLAYLLRDLQLTPEKDRKNDCDC